MIIDAKNMILGRLATKIAKLALLGEDIIVVNSGLAVISGSRVYNIIKLKQKQDRGTHVKGPFYPRSSDLILKRVVRGMLPFKNARGRDAYKRIKCFSSMPKSIDQSKLTVFDEYNLKNSKGIKNYVYLNEITKINGGKK